MVLRMMMRWAERRGFEVELLEASPGEEAGIKSATFRAAGENAYGLYSAEKGVHRLVRLSPVRLGQPAPDVLRRRRGLARGRGGRRASRSTTTTCRSTPTARRAPAASTSTRPTRRCGSRTSRRGIVVQCQNERSQSSNRATAMAMLRSKLIELEERKRAEEIARERGEAQDVNFGSQIRSYVLHPYTMVKDHRTDFEVGNANGVLDGDLDGFVHAYLLQERQGRSSLGVHGRRRGPAHGRRETRAADRAVPRRGLGATPSAARRASTSRGTRAARARTRACAPPLGDAALAVDVPADIHGIDLGPSPTPFQRAEALAAEAHGAERSWFLTNGATQGNHALCLALAPLGALVVVQRNSHASVVDGLVLSGGVPDLRRAGVRRTSSGMAHGVTPEALERGAGRSARARRARRSSSRRPTTAWPPTWRAARRSATRPACRSWSTSRGARTSASTRACRPARSQLGADAVLTSTHKIVGSLTQSAMLHVAPTGRIDPAAVARTIRLTRSHVALRAADDLAGRRAAPARRARRGAAGPHAGRGRRGARGDRRAARRAR